MVRFTRVPLGVTVLALGRWGDHTARGARSPVRSPIELDPIVLRGTSLVGGITHNYRSSVTSFLNDCLEGRGLQPASRAKRSRLCINKQCAGVSAA